MKFKLWRLLLCIAAIASGIILLFGCASVQRKLLYFPSHQLETNGLTEWQDQGHLIGFAHEVPSPKNVWLMLHGNGGQAAHRASIMPHFSTEDSVYVLEYPGYGSRSGTPSKESFNTAARQAYEILRERFQNLPVCVVGESLGTGPTSFLTTCSRPPDKIVLLVPYDELAKVAADHYPFLPVRLLLHDNWNNSANLANYHGPLEIFAATDDTVIPIAHARALAATKPQAVFHEIPGGHGAWYHSERVQIRYP